jgi:hypothetical protein
MAITNLGQISVVHKGATAPTNTDLIWQDTSASMYVFKSYDLITSTWVTFNNGSPIISSAASAASITPDMTAYDMYKLTAQTVALTINNPTNVVGDGQALNINILASGGDSALTWGAQFRGLADDLPAFAFNAKWLKAAFQWDATDSKWDLIGYVSQT